MAGAEIKVSVNLANKNKVKAKNFIIPIFTFLSSFCGHYLVMNRLLPLLFQFLSSLKTFFKASEKQITINEI